MADTIRYINTDSTPGGDGTTNATTGVNRAYANADEWEGAEQTSIAIGDRHIVKCDGTLDANQLNVSGWTIPDGAELIIEGNDGNRPGSKWDSSKYHLHHTTSTLYQDTMEINEDNVTVRNLQVALTQNNADAYSSDIIDLSTGVDNCKFHNLILKADGAVDSLLLGAPSSGHGNHEAKNIIAYATQGSELRNGINFGVYGSPIGSKIINCTIYGVTDSYSQSNQKRAFAVRGDGGSNPGKIRNCIAVHRYYNETYSRDFDAINTGDTEDYNLGYAETSGPDGTNDIDDRITIPSDGDEVYYNEGIVEESGDVSNVKTSPMILAYRGGYRLGVARRMENNGTLDYRGAINYSTGKMYWKSTSGTWRFSFGSYTTDSVAPLCGLNEVDTGYSQEHIADNPISLVKFKEVEFDATNYLFDVVDFAQRSGSRANGNGVGNNTDSDVPLEDIEGNIRDLDNPTIGACEFIPVLGDGGMYRGLNRGINRGMN